MRCQRTSALLGSTMLDAHERCAARSGAVSKDEPGRCRAGLTLGARPWDVRAGVLEGVSEDLPTLMAGVAAVHEHTGELVCQPQILAIRVARAVAERADRFRESAALAKRPNELGTGTPARRTRGIGGGGHEAPKGAHKRAPGPPGE